MAAASCSSLMTDTSYFDNPTDGQECRWTSWRWRWPAISPAWTTATSQVTHKWFEPSHLCVTWLVAVENWRLATRVRSQASASARMSICSLALVGKSVEEAIPVGGAAAAAVAAAGDLAVEVVPPVLQRLELGRSSLHSFGVERVELAVERGARRAEQLLADEGGLVGSLGRPGHGREAGRAAPTGCRSDRRRRRRRCRSCASSPRGRCSRRVADHELDGGNGVPAFSMPAIFWSMLMLVAWLPLDILPAGPERRHPGLVRSPGRPCS